MCATLAPWSCLDAQGRELRINDLSTSLTQTAACRRTICSVTALETYLLRRLNAEADAQVERVEGLMADLTTAVGTVIADLHWRDFEVLVDLIFARSGWRPVAGAKGSPLAPLASSGVGRPGGRRGPCRVAARPAPVGAHQRKTSG